MARYRIVTILSGFVLTASLMFSLASFIYAQATNDWYSIPNPINGGNPIDSVAVLCGIAASIRSYGLPFAVFAIVLLGVRMVIAAATDNPGDLAQAKKLLVYAIVGAAIVAAAVVLVNASVSFISSISGGTASCG